MTIEWPCDILKPQNVAFNLVPRSLSAPASVTGLGQVVASDAGTWKATFGSVLVRNREQVLKHRELAALLEGRLVPILVPLCGAWAPLPAGAPANWKTGVPHSDTAPFSDGSLYVAGMDFDNFIATAAAPARATTIRVTIGDAEWRIEPGMHFSVGERLYRVRTVTYTSSHAATLTFRPPLREAVAIRTILNFDDPVCRMRLYDDAGMDLELELHRYGTPSVEFVEDL